MVLRSHSRAWKRRFIRAFALGRADRRSPDTLTGFRHGKLLDGLRDYYG